MDNFPTFILIIQLIILFFQIAITQQLISNKNAIEKFVPLAEEYVEAFNEVKKVVNTNTKLFAGWTSKVQDIVIELAFLKTITEIHSHALKITYPKIDVPEELESVEL